MSLIETHGIEKRFGAKVALDTVSVDIPEGKICGLLGPNGAGKTTLMRILTRILRPDRGTVVFDNRPLCDRDMDHIGYLPEGRGLYNAMSVTDELVFLARIKGIPRQEAKRLAQMWIEKLGLGDRARHLVGSLSKGLQQKVQFIGAVIASPRLLILDEPFSGLDPIGLATMRAEILDLQQQGTTILLSTHHLNEAATLCSHVILINQGRVGLQGCLEEIKKRHASSLYRFTTEKSIILQEERSLFSIVETTGREHIVKMNKGISVSELSSFLSREYPLSRFEAQETTLEEIFTQVVSCPLQTDRSHE